MPKPDNGTATPSHDQDFDWELPGPGELARLREIGPFEVNDGIDRLRRGDLCYTVVVDGRLAHYAWVQSSGVHPITAAGVQVPVAGGEVWIYDCMTAEWARGRGIYPATLRRIAADRFAGGCRCAWIYTPADNRASQRGILRAGFERAATLQAFRFGRRYFPLGRFDLDRLRASSYP